MKSFYITLAATMFVLFSCNNDDDTAPEAVGESLVFGTYAGECFGDCFDVFRIDNEKLEEDQVVDFFGEAYDFKASFTFSNELFNKYKGILKEIPNELIDGSDKTYGCPDCADQGGFYFMIQTKEGKVKKYTVDTRNTKDQSAAIIAFKNRISEIIKDLSATSVN